LYAYVVGNVIHVDSSLLTRRISYFGRHHLLLVCSLLQVSLLLFISNVYGETIMQVREVMSPSPKVLAADATIREAAIQMRDCSSGLMPIQKNDRLIGMLTDRDITVRGIAGGKSLDDKVTDIIAEEVLYCFENDDVKSVLKNMQQQQVQRLVVLNNDQSKDLVGIVSVADIADKCEDTESAKAIVECCRHYH